MTAGRQDEQRNCHGKAAVAGTKHESRIEQASVSAWTRDTQSQELTAQTQIQGIKDACACTYTRFHCRRQAPEVRHETHELPQLGSYCVMKPR